MKKIFELLLFLIPIIGIIICTLFIFGFFKNEEINSLNIVSSLKINVSEIVQLMDEDNAKNIKWESSDSNIVEVNNGTIKGIKKGNAIITATTIDGKKVMCQVEVRSSNKDATPTPSPTSSSNMELATKVTLNKKSLTLTEGNSETLIATIEPSNTIDKTVTWTSSNTNVATVDNGKITAKSKGTTTITAKTSNGKTDTCTVTVNAKVVTYKVTFNPDNGTNPTTMDVKQNGTVTPPVVTKSGYTLIGWYNGSTKFDFTKPINSNLTLTAKWQKQGTIIRVGTFNVGYYKCGSYSGATCSSGEHTSYIHPNFPGTYIDPKAIAREFKNNKLDFVGVQETHLVKNGASYTTGADILASAIYGSDDAANTKRGKYWSYTSYTIALYSSSSTYQFQNITSKALSTGRGLLKGVVNINGVNISIYNTHLALGDYTAVNINEIVEELKKDNNPIIIMGDFNVSPNNPSAENNLKTKLENLGFTLAAKDTTKNNMWKKPALCDSIWVKSNGHINVKSQNTIQKYNVLSDHNMVITELEIVK